MNDADRHHEHPGIAAEEQGIVDQQAAALEAIAEAEPSEQGDEEGPMTGEAPTG
jgi:hypothetical protein